MIQDLTGMMVERLLAYEAASKVLPKRIIIYRNGVDEVRSFALSRLGVVFRRNRRDYTIMYSKKSSARRCEAPSRRSVEA